MISFKFKAAGVDLAPYVERDSYTTAVQPVFTETVTTMDGVDHDKLLRLRGSVTVKLNPQSAGNAAKISAALLGHPVEVEYFCLQRQAVVVASMRAPAQTAQFLSRCLAGGQQWSQAESITLKEM
nr:MAG TPA: hypothetical protein [Caudoviricetes sp.]